MISTRPFLCPDGRDAADLDPWVPSADNPWWRPTGSVYPSTNLLLPGDVLLFAPHEPSFVQRGIARSQKRGRAEDEDSRFTHAALYLGLDHIVCEATLGTGVMYSLLDLDFRLDKYCWIARRWPGLTLAQRQRILTMAARYYVGKPYNWRSALAEGMKRDSGANWEQEKRGLVCSRLCERSIVLALLEASRDSGEDALDLPGDGYSFTENPREFVTPAVLSRTKRLVDVEVGWRSLTASA